MTCKRTNIPSLICPTCDEPASAHGSYIDLGTVVHDMLDMQMQYAVRYLDSDKYPTISAGIRWQGNLVDYHEIRIHSEDVNTFVKRVQEHLRSIFPES